MTTDHVETPEVDDLLRDHLNRRARLVTTPPDLRARIERRHRRHRRRRTAGRAAMASATVAVVAGAGIVGFANRSNEMAIAPAAGPAAEILATARSEQSAPAWCSEVSEVIVWLDPEIEATEITAVDEALRARSDLTDLRYIDVDETYAEFTAYFADEPELVELVEPEELPTSFQATVADPAALPQFRSSIQPLPGVNQVESCLSG